MEILSSLLEHLKADEGLKLFVYDDATGRPIIPGTTVIGNPTIGYGIALNTRGITHAEALYLLDNAARDAIYDAQALDWWHSLNDARKLVICNMIYQMGVGGVLKFRNMIRAIKARDYAKAADEMLDSKWHRNDSPKRAKRLAEVMRNGY